MHRSSESIAAIAAALAKAQGERKTEVIGMGHGGSTPLNPPCWNG
jgi:hypothetical protein